MEKNDNNLQHLQQNNKKMMLDMESFETYVFHLRELYSERQSNEFIDKVTILKSNNYFAFKFWIFYFLKDLENNEFPRILKDSESYNYTLIGVANLFLDLLYHDVLIDFEYSVPVINQQGEIAGKLKIKMMRIDVKSFYSTTGESEMEISDSRRSTIKFRLTIIEASDLPFSLNNTVFCKYRFWRADQETVVKQFNENSNNSRQIVKFNHQQEFEIEANEEFFDYLLDSALSIEIFSHRTTNISPQEQLSNLMDNKLLPNQKSFQEEINRLTQIAKCQSLIDSWNEVSKSFELGVKILELNSDGKLGYKKCFFFS